MKLKTAFGMTDHAEAPRELTKVRGWLMSISDAAVTSLEEGFEELLTSLKKLFSSTNMIASCYSVVGDMCHNVKRWRGESFARRWAGTMLHVDTKEAISLNYETVPECVNSNEKRDNFYLLAQGLFRKEKRKSVW
jgi:hypothetical protein